MAETVRLGAEGSRHLAALWQAVRKLPARSERLELQLKSGADAVENDEVQILVLGQHGCLVSRKSVRGRPIDLRELRLQLASAEVAVEGIGRRPRAASPPLSSAEAALLDKAGFVESDGDAPGAFEKSQIAYEMLLRDSFTLARAAKLLGVNASRLRQRLGQRTLYGIMEGRAWRVPRFQFDLKRHALVRGIEKVFPKIRADAHPLEVATWFSVPHQDLVVGDDEEPVTPLEWLASGRPPETVAKLADEI